MAVIFVDPRRLRLPPSRKSGADPYKLQRQIAKYGAGTVGMPPLEVIEAPGQQLVIINDVTRASRIAKLAPGTLVPVLVVGTSKKDAGRLPTVGDGSP
jgi:hypothetical protein